MTPPSSTAPVRNKLLSRLVSADRDAIRPHLERVELSGGQRIETPNQPIDYVYFPEDGIASVIATDGGKLRIEAGPFGREGMSGLPIVLDTGTSPHETSMQVGGSAYRIRAEDFRSLLAREPSLRMFLLRYVQAFNVQTAHTAMVASIAVVERRLARWILMLHDRIDGDELGITHDFMALMLSVRRPGVTVALHVLEGNGLIRSVRGRLIVRDRAGLEAMCAGLYGVPEAEYRRLLGGL